MAKKTPTTTLSGDDGFKKPTAFRMAYSLNNQQPVMCTMISDQPFFYMDEEVLLEEDGLLSDDMFCEFDDLDHEFLEQEITSLKNKMDAYEKVSSEFSQKLDASLEDFIADSQTFSNVSYDEVQADQIISKIKETLSDSRYSQELLNFADNNGIEFVLHHEGQNVSYDSKEGKILISSHIDFADQILLTVQELRRHWQHKNGALVHPLTFHPEQAVLINRAQLADLSVAVIRAAWELKLQNHTEFWARIENSAFSDLGRAFAREAISDFRTLNNGKASAAVFETWFLSERCRYQDKELIQAMLADYRGYVFENSETSKMVSIDLICALGEQPFGKNYLAAYAHMILNDPVFTDVRDRSNANFLWFIKFERSFIETEQELQSSRQPTKSGVDQTVNNDIIEDTQYEDSDRFSTTQHTQDNVIRVQFGQQQESCEGILS